MGRIRTIKPEFFESESVTELPIRARLTWIGLWTHCDDHGRAKANAKLIKAAVWPLDKISLNEVEKDLDDLEALCLIVRYEVSGKNYLAVTNWDEHQAAAYRRGEAKYPPPPTFNGDVQKSASRTVAEVNQHESPANKGMQKSASRTQMRAGTGNREQGTGNREQHADACNDDDFERFWKTYPKRKAKGQAVKAWRAALKKADADTIITAAFEFANLSTGKDPTYIPHPSTWLNGERWADDDTTTPPRTIPVAELPPPPRDIADDPEACRSWYDSKRAERQAS